MISQKRYVEITSGVGGATAVSTRQYTLRLITQNPALQAGVVKSFDNADDVGNLFGTSSEEFLRASMYFSFVNKSISAPAAISFVHWNTAAAAPSFAGDTSTKSLSALQAVSAGVLNIVVNGSTKQISGIDLSSATDLTSVASLVQTAIRTNSDAMLSQASLTYNTNNNQFSLTGSTTGPGTLSISVSTSSADIATLLGFQDGTASDGQNAQEPVDVISQSAANDNNFGSFVFCTPATPLTTEQIVAIASWNSSQNVMYMYSLSAVQSAMSALSAALIGYSGVALNVAPSATDGTYTDQAPCEILASIDYTAANATQNFMFYQFTNRSASITNDSDANSMDALRANYIGQTQSAGKQLSFYQRGVLMGAGTSPIDMNTYANEMWLKDYISAQFLSALLALPEVAANEDGRAAMIAVLQGAVDQAKYNGVISAGKTLSTQQQLYITQQTGDRTAYRQVATNGYWYSVQILSRTNTNSGLVEYYAKYLLVYGKDDAIRYVQGTDTLI